MSSSPIQNDKRLEGGWNQISPYLIPPFAASFAIILPFHGFVIKSAQQEGRPIPRVTLKKAIIGGIRAAPSIGTTVGIQMIGQGYLERLLKKITKQKDKLSFSSMIVSSLAIGIISAPPLAVFNGQTMGHSVMQSLRMLSAKQAMAITCRETSFLFSIRISDPLGKAMKDIIGDNKFVEYSSAFFSGVIGSFVGHPADTALTLWQRKMKLVSFRQLMRGAPMRAFATGSFAVFYKLAKQFFNYANS